MRTPSRSLPRLVADAAAGVVLVELRAADAGDLERLFLDLTTGDGK